MIKKHQQTSIRFDAEDYARVAAAARAQHEPLSIYMRKAILQRVEKEKSASEG